jgi:carbamoyltransferase
MKAWGIAALSHDASLAVVDDGRILFAAHAERYSRVKNDPLLNDGILAEALQYGAPDVIAWYERPIRKKLRHLRAGQFQYAVSTRDIPSRYLARLGLPFRLPPVVSVDHHLAHAMAGFATSDFTDAAVIVADAIGEFTTFTIGEFRPDGSFTARHRLAYPHSLGLLYSAFTRRCGFRPNEDEYIVMGMAAVGEPRYVNDIYEDFVELAPPTFRLRRNVHRGIGDWRPGARQQDLAASIQTVTEEIMLNAARWAHDVLGARRLVLMGGVALNCTANSRIAEEQLFDGIWIFPNPGDAGSSVGAAAAVAGGKLAWEGPYLGTDISGPYAIDEALRELRSGGIVGVANGRAEFGPRALGNRSLLADPRPADMKDRVNRVKGREPFRPFAPVIREDRAPDFFVLPDACTAFMQFTAQCRFPHQFPAVVHSNGSSRVQTVSSGQHPQLFTLLTRWEAETGCPMLLNTSLNSRGEPIVNDWGDASRLAAREEIPVY